jgi:glycerate 2-kinase
MANSSVPVNLLNEMFQAAVSAAMPQYCVPAHLPPKPSGRVIVVGVGKSAAAMAKAVEEAWGDDLEGLVITRYGHHVPTRRIEVIEAAHPVPDENGMEGARRIFERVQGLTEDDLVLCLISGGGSSLFTWPPEGITLAELANINQQLLKSGAAITDMNTVRKNLSRSSGGRLAAAAYPARVVSLIISDVPGDNLAAIASGPTVGDTVTAADALAIIRRYRLDVPPHILTYLEQNPNPVVSPEDMRLSRTQNVLIATPQLSLEAAAKVAADHGYTPLILGNALEGEAKDVGIVHAGIAKQIKGYGQPLSPPCILLSGGETTVTVKQGGKGGRNSTFLLGLTLALQGLPGVYAIACDTDGIDGSEDNAGALMTPDIWARAEQLGINPAQYLETNDSYSFFAALDLLVETGPTLTNVNDFRAILIEG